MKAEREGTAFEPGISEKLDFYNVVWDTPGAGSADSMPIGNGDLTANVWTEADGRVSFYIGKGDSWSEALRLLKIGRVDVELFPNPFENQKEFRQTLCLKEGEIRISAGEAGKRVFLRLWADAGHPAIRVEMEGEQEFEVRVTAYRLRTAPHKGRKTKERREQNNWNFCDSPVEEPEESADVFLKNPDMAGWYHRNETSPYETILTYQNAGEFFRSEDDPFLHRTFGAAMAGTGLEQKSESCMEGTGKRRYCLSVCAHTSICDSAEAWEEEIAQKLAEVQDGWKDTELLRAEHRNWWTAFWNRSWIFAEGDEQAELVTRGYLLQRYMQAIQARAAYPVKFNGGSLTFDYQGENPDYREWGAPYWFQNTRLLYWNMLASGDFDMMKPLFAMYEKALELQKKITRKYYGHEGAFFPETTNFFGGYTLLDFYWGDLSPHTGTEPRNDFIRYYWQGGLELSYMMLEYYSYTRDEAFLKDEAVPFAEQMLLFYDRHFLRDGQGKLRLYPTHSLETYWENVCNPSEQLAALTAVLMRLLSLQDGQISAGQRACWERFLDEIPPLPVETDENGSYLAVAEHYEPLRHNNENPELYAVFPYRLFGLEKENTELAKGAWDRRKSLFNHCWSQNGIQAAYLGLAEEAKKAVISHFSNQAEKTRFPAFWGNGNDWVPDLDNGGSAMSALQAMLLQCDGEKTYFLPAWPKEWSVDCRLHGTDRRTFRICYEAGKEPVIEADT